MIVTRLRHAFKWLRPVDSVVFEVLQQRHLSFRSRYVIVLFLALGAAYIYIVSISIMFRIPIPHENRDCNLSPA